MTQFEQHYHPVWSVYDELRTSRLNVKYLQHQIARLKVIDRWTEILIAIATTSSIGSFWFLKNSVGAYFWQTIGAVAVVLSIVRPILKFSSRIQNNEKLLSRYSILEHDIHCICINIRHRQKYDNELHEDFLEVMNRKADLLKINTDADLDEALRKKCEALVDSELPLNSFYIPES